MSIKPINMMRTKGLSGPFVQNNVKTVGNYYFPIIADFLNFSGTEYGELPEPIVLVGDFELEATCQFNAEDSTIIGDDNNESWIRYSTGSNITAKLGNIYNVSPTFTSLIDGKLHTIKVTKVGDVLEYFVDGVSVGTDINGATTVTFTRIGQKAGISYFDGTIKSIIVRDYATPSNSRNYQLTKAADEYIQPIGVGLGDELVVNGGFDTDSDWTLPTTRGTATILNGECVITNDGVDSYPNISQPFTMIENRAYLVTADFDIGTSLKGRIHIYDSVNYSSYNQELTESGKFSFVYVCASDTSTSLNIYNYETGNTGSYCTFDNISVKEIPQALLLNNVTLTDWTKYRFDRSLNAWVGREELVVNGDFSDGDAEWVKTDGGQTVEVVGGKAHINTDGTSCGYYQSILEFGKTYLVTADYEVITGKGDIRLGSSGDYELTGSGKIQIIGQPEGSTILYIWRRGSLAGDFYVDNISVREIIQLP